MQRPLLIVLVILAIGAATPAEATVRSYFSPEWKGARLAACLDSGASCGKPAADAFCKAQGFERSLHFQREAYDHTRAIGSEAICDGQKCTAFRQIKCYSHAATVSPAVQ